MCDVEVRDRRNNQVCPGLQVAGVVAARHAHRSQASFARRLQAPPRVFDRDALVRVQRRRHLLGEQRHRSHVRIRRRLARRCVFGRDDGGEVFQQSGAFQHAPDLRTERSGGNRNRYGRGRASDGVRRARKENRDVAFEFFEPERLVADETGDVPSGP